MGAALGAALAAWHDFYMLVGTAAATLVGLMFVAASIGASYFTREQEVAAQTFISPTVVHFAAILVACLLILAPLQGWTSLGAMLLGESALGIAYTGLVWWRLRHQRFAAAVGLVDRVWYALTPAAGYGLLAASSLGLLNGRMASLDLLAGGLFLLLLAGIRNAWDMTLWVMLRSGTRN